MIGAELKRYERYKDSGVEWLGKVPEHWELARIKEVGSVNGRVGWKALKASEYVDDGFAFLATPNIKNKDIDYKNVNYITHERYVESPEIMLKEEDILLVKDGSTLGISNIIENMPRETTVNSSIAVLRFKGSIFNKYILYQIKSSFIQNKINLKKSGMGVPHLFQQDINNFVILKPNYEEQQAITAYLDEKTNRIDRKIKLLTAKADRYRELKQALINETVTRGLDPTVTMKDSGVEWIGVMPAHWEVKRWKDIIYLKSGDAGIYKSDIGIYPIYGANGIIGMCDFYNQVEKKLLIGRVGSCGAITEATGKYVVSDNALIVSLKKSVFYKFVFYKLIAQNLENISTKNAQPLLTGTAVKNLITSLSSYEEQQAIATYLGTKTAQIDQIITTITTQVRTLQELRKTLINDVVTGKIKVV